MTLIVLSIAVLALIIAFSTSLSASVDHRSLAANDVVLRSATESAISLIQQKANPAYVSCGTPSSPNYASLNFGTPSGYTAAITAVTYWNYQTSQFDPSVTQDNCTPNAPELITLTVTNQSNGTKVWTNFTVDSRGKSPASAFSITGVSPSTVPAGIGNVTLSITGTGFLTGSTVTFSGSGVNVISTTWVSSTSLSVNVSISGSAPAGTRTITDTNQGSGGTSVTSGPIFTVTVTGVSTKLLVSNMVGSVDGSSDQSWDALVTVYVEDTNGNTVPGVKVSGFWDTTSGTNTSTCVTGSSGSCLVEDGVPLLLNASNFSQTFIVTNLSLTGYTYDAAGNFASPALATATQP